MSTDILISCPARKNTMCNLPDCFTQNRCINLPINTSVAMCKSCPNKGPLQQFADCLKAGKCLNSPIMEDLKESNLQQPLSAKPEPAHGLFIHHEMMNAIKQYDTNEVAAFMEKIFPAMITLFRSKDINYGGSWQHRGILSAQMNFERKIDRINAQFYNGTISARTNENIADTFIDNAVYSVMYLWLLYMKVPHVREQVDSFIANQQ